MVTWIGVAVLAWVAVSIVVSLAVGGMIRLADTRRMVRPSGPAGVRELRLGSHPTLPAEVAAPRKTLRRVS